MEKIDELELDRRVLLQEIAFAKATGDYEQVTLLQLDLATVRKKLEALKAEMAKPKCTCADFDGFVDCPVHI